MRLRAATALVAAMLGLAACAERPQLVMINPHTGATVGCPVPDTLAGSGEFLVSRACLSACSAHGFHPMLGVESKGSGDTTPEACLN
jgi:hypothetical protein